MKKPINYFQFPLCTLAFGQNEQERFNAIIDYSIVELGRKAWNRLSSEKQQSYLDKWRGGNGGPPRDFRISDPFHCYVMLGSSIIGVSYSSIESFRKNHAALRDFHARYTSEHGKDATIRIRRDILFDARDKKKPTYREFSVLAAIYSVIGSKQKPVRITQQTIRLRALGYKSRAAYEAGMYERTDETQPLTDWQLRSTIDRLLELKFFVRSTYARRQSFYSHRMTPARLRKAIYELKTYSHLSRLNRVTEDQIMTENIKNRRAQLSGKPLPFPYLNEGLEPSSRLEGRSDSDIDEERPPGHWH